MVVEEPMPGAIRQDDWFVLLDPARKTGSSDLPPEAIVGGWMVEDDGTVGPFQPNPRYVPGDTSTPTDPIDAILRRIAGGEQLADDLVESIRNAVVEIGCDEQDRPLVGTGPDGTVCAVIATAATQKLDVDVDRWWPVVGSELPNILPPETDILLNPHGMAPFRLATDALRDAD